MPSDGPDPANGAALQLPQVWRIPPWQPAALILLAAVLAALDIYGGLSLSPLILTALVAAGAVGTAVFAIRMVLVADDYGIWVRRLGRAQLVEWSEIASIEAVVTGRSTTTVRISRKEGGHVDVPPSLLLPTLPTKVPKARTLAHNAALELNRIAATQRA